jgi:hypothetical protein
MYCIHLKEFFGGQRKANTLIARQTANRIKEKHHKLRDLPFKE